MGNKMIDEHSSINYWLNKTRGHIRYKPDWEAIREELLANYEDHRNALICAGLPEEQAEKRALMALGDPDETGELLNKIHSPLLGLSYRISQWTLGLLLLCLAVVAIKHIVSPDHFTNPYYYGYPVPSYYEEYFSSTFSSDLDKEPLIVKTGTSTDNITAGKYRIALEQAVIRAFDENNTGELTAVLRVDAALNSDPPYVLLNSIYAEDDLGNQYRFGYTGPYDGEFMGGNLYTSLVGRKLQSYYVLISIPSGDKNMNQLDIVHESEANSFRFRVLFTGR